MMMKPVKIRILKETYDKIFESVGLPLYHGSKHPNLNWDDRVENADYNMLGYGYYLTTSKDEAIYYATKHREDDKRIGYLYTFNPIGANIINWTSKVSDEHIKNINSDGTIINKLYYTKDDVDVLDIDVEDYYFKFGDYEYDWDEYDDGYFIEIVDDLPKLSSEEYLVRGLRDINKIPLIIRNDLKRRIGSKKIKADSIEIDTMKAFYNSPDELSIDNIFDTYANLYTYLFTIFKSTKKVSIYFKKIGIDGITQNIDTSDFASKDTQVVVAINMNKFKQLDKKIVG